MSGPVGASHPGAASFDDLDDLDDAALVARALHDPDAFRALFRRHVDAIHAFVWRRTRDATLADDLTAVVFERCWSSLSRLEPRADTIRPWLVRVAANEIASHYRSDGRRRRREHLVAVREEPLRSVHDPRIDEVDGKVLDAISTLGNRHQEVLSLRFFADLSTAEAAETLGVSRSHFAVLQHRAVGALRRRLAERERGDDHG